LTGVAKCQITNLWQVTMANGDPLGCGIAASTGFPLVMRLCWGEENLQNACLRRLNADQGSLASIGDDPTYGRNVAALLNKSFDRPSDMAAEGSQIAAELRKDERVQSATARVATGQGSLIVVVQGQSAAGPFSLVAGVGDMTVDRLNQGITAPITGATA
jgi:hypothetical protein